MTDESYWNFSSVKANANRLRMFDDDDSNSIDESLLDSSRATPVLSARYRPAASNPPPAQSIPAPTRAPQIKPVINQTKTPTPPVQTSRTVEQPKESARFGRSPASVDSHANAQWVPTAEDYHDNPNRDGSTLFDKEMELICGKLLKKESVDLSGIRDYDKKVSLLRIALSFDTPSVTVPVIIFLENTLSKPLFYELIKPYPSAVNNYMNMAKLRLGNDYYVAMLKQFGRNENAAMIRLQQASQTNDINTKMAILDQAATELGSHPWWHLQLSEQRLLLLKQREANNTQANRTVLEAYKSVYKDDFLKSKQKPTSNRVEIDRSREYESTFHMSQEMIMCGKLSVIMHCGIRQYYNDFVHQAIHQGIFGKKYIIAPEYLADMVYKWVLHSGEGETKAAERADQFLKMIPDPDRRIYYAEKFHNYDVAIYTVANDLRDRFQLENLRRRIPREHPAYNTATALLENTKWRN